MSREWLDQLREFDIDAVAAVGGMVAMGQRSLSPCPSCKAEVRGSEDKARGPIGCRSDRRGWHCHRCDEGGDVVNLAAWLATGSTRELTRENAVEVRAWCVDRRLVDGDPAPGAAARPRIAPPRPAEELPPARPPAGEVEELWNRCVPVRDDVATSEYLRGRGFDLDKLVALDCVRAIPPPPFRLPRWAYFANGTTRGPWNAVPQQFRIAVQMVGPMGAIESLHVRALRPMNPKGTDKAAAPAGAQVIGLVMACPAARAMLAGGAEKPSEVVIAEGEPDWLSWRQKYASDTRAPPAIVGIIAGSFSGGDIAARIPDGVQVWVRTHADKGGKKYAEQIVAALAPRCPVFIRNEHV